MMEEDEEEEEEEEEDNSNSNPPHIPTDCFPCPHCDRTFPLKQLLDLHVPIHSREKNFECGECIRKFFTKVIVCSNIFQFLPFLYFLF